MLEGYGHEGMGSVVDEKPPIQRRKDEYPGTDIMNHGRVLCSFCEFDVFHFYNPEAFKLTGLKVQEFCLLKW